MSTIDPFVLFDDALARQATLLQGFDSQQTVNASDLTDLDALLRQGWAKGRHAALFIPYEFGMTGRPGQSERSHTALHIHWFSEKSTLFGLQIDQWLAQQAAGHDPQRQPAGLCDLHLQPDFDEYQAQFNRLQDAIVRGDFYQINYTARQCFDTYGSPLALYRLLRAKQPVPYGVLAWLPEQAFSPWTLCLSPELFIRIDEDGILRAEPMKGTLPYREGDNVEMLSQQLRTDTKNRAENLMIVDLLRNDLSILAEPGGVQVEELFKVTRFGEVLQMTTPIQCLPGPCTTLADVIAALFPCGSITGAPKKMSMQYIVESETSTRGLYTGSIGYLQPSQNRLGATGCFNVVIRTLSLYPRDGRALACSGVMGVGGGIVYDSTARSEYDEIHWKSRFVGNLASGFELFETMLVEHGQCALLDRHIERLVRSARRLGFAADHEALTRQLQHAITMQAPASRLRMRAVLFPDGRCDVQFSPLDTPVATAGMPGINHSVRTTEAIPTLPTVSVAKRILPLHDPLRRFKTTWRRYFDNDLQEAMTAGDFDVLYFNHDGYLLEGARTSVFIHYDGAWLTPALTLDILPGVMRNEVLTNPRKYLQTDRVSETMITRAVLAQADAIVLTNALRGCVPVMLKSA